jgi:protein phosphatase
MIQRHARVPSSSEQECQGVTPIDPRSIEIAERTDIGRLRESNQDACGHREVAGHGRLLFVADGMGGHAGGETASRIAVESVTQAFHAEAEVSGPALAAALEAANRHILEEARINRKLRGMGTTGVALLFAADGAYVANVGDSRAYRQRDGAITQLTQDHSLVAELVRRGALSEEQARVHPRRNELIRCLGVDVEVEVDVDRLEVVPGDDFLLCTDGLFAVLRDEEILRILLDSTPAEAVVRLVAAANDKGGPDNVTVQVAHVP